MQVLKRFHFRISICRKQYMQWKKVGWQMNKRVLGAQYEALAAKWLERQGYRILVRNFRSRFGEIDLVALDEKEEQPVLVFVEVKYRNTASSGYAEEAVGLKKQETIRRTADFYRVRYQVRDSVPCRFDVIAFQNGRLRHIEDAF